MFLNTQYSTKASEAKKKHAFFFTCTPTMLQRGTIHIIGDINRVLVGVGLNLDPDLRLPVYLIAAHRDLRCE